MRLQYFGHSAFMISAQNGKTILIDPFLDANPLSPIKSDDIKADYIVLTHAHSDHLGDSCKIAKRCNPLFICVNELANYIKEHGFRAYNMHIGGSHVFDFGRLKFTIAHHGSQTPDKMYAGLAAGVLLTCEGVTLYHTGDTGLFYDMKLIGEMNPIDYMILPIGDNYTMGINDAVKAVELCNPKVAIPMHYNTFPIIEADPQVFSDKLKELGKQSIIMDPGQELIL